jgi:hypothetical protein
VGAPRFARTEHSVLGHEHRSNIEFTLSGGTGKYARITGSGNAMINELAIASRIAKSACNLNGTPVANEETITGTANVKL